MRTLAKVLLSLCPVKHMANAGSTHSSPFPSLIIVSTLIPRAAISVGVAAPFRKLSKSAEGLGRK